MGDCYKREGAQSNLPWFYKTWVSWSERLDPGTKHEVLKTRRRGSTLLERVRISWENNEGMHELFSANGEPEWEFKHHWIGLLLLDPTQRRVSGSVKLCWSFLFSAPARTQWYDPSVCVLTDDTVWPGRGLSWQEAGRGCTGWFCWAAPGLCCCCCCCCWDWTESWGTTAHRRATVRTQQEPDNLI